MRGQLQVDTVDSFKPLAASVEPQSTRGDAIARTIAGDAKSPYRANFLPKDATDLSPTDIARLVQVAQTIAAENDYRQLETRAFYAHRATEGISSHVLADQRRELEKKAAQYDLDCRAHIEKRGAVFGISASEFNFLHRALSSTAQAEHLRVAREVRQTAMIYKLKASQAMHATGA